MQNVVVTAAVNTLIATLGGHDPVESLEKSLLVSLADEAVIGLDAYLTIERGTETPLSVLGGTAVNSMRANIQHGRPLCQDVRATYLIMDFIFDCGDFDVGVNVTPLLGALYFQLAGDDLEMGRSLRIGVPSFHLNDAEVVSGLAVGGAIGHTEGPAGRVATTIIHELRHVLQHDLLEKSMERVDGPWYVHSRLGTPRVGLGVSPIGSATAGLLIWTFGHDFVLWEATADTEAEGWR